MDTLRELQAAEADNHKRIDGLEKTVAVINAKLNAILAIMSAVGAALLGVLVRLIFGA